jgi:lipoprotein-anchoring transpeptidase ErfK/SrfK
VLVNRLRPVARRALVVAVAGMLAGTLAACRDAEAGTAAPGATITTPAVPEAAVTVTPADAATGVRPDAPVQVSVAGGSIVDVAVVATGDEGTPLTGVAGEGRHSWASTSGLRPGQAYQVRVDVVDDAGRRSEHTSGFTTLSPAAAVEASVTPRDGWTVGVGMPVVVNFDHTVAKESRAAVERRLSVATTPALEGARRWESATQVQWRPRDFWPSGATATVDVDLTGVEVAPGVWGTDTKHATFSVGSAMVSTVDVANHTMTVRRDGEVLRTIPITTGKGGFETRNGTKVIISRETKHRMDAATTGIERDDPEYYDLVVDYAMRLTWSGEFIHAAPWSAGQQGSANVSHGCTGMSDADARWLFERSKVGDVVEFVGSDRALEWGNGYTAWNMGFERWAQGSALSG